MKAMEQEHNSSNTEQQGGTLRQNCLPQCPRHRLCLWRCILILSLISAAAITGGIAYTEIRRLEHNLATSTYDSVAEAALERARSFAQDKIQAAALLADLFGNAFPDASTWPFVALPGFTSAASRAGFITQLNVLVEKRLTDNFAFSPLVKPNQIRDFDAYAQDFYRQAGYEEGAGVSPFGFGVFDQHQNSTRYRADGQGSNYNATYSIAAPPLPARNWKGSLHAS